MANALTVGALTLASTFECISVEAKYTGDDNANATAVVEYKKSSDSTWLPALDPFIDRRTTINGHDNSAHAKEARVSIFWCSSNTAYDVRVTWTDADGVTGTNPVTGSVTTLNPSPTTAVRTVNVANDAALTTALSGYVAGDDIILAAGSYSARSFSLAGNSGAWVRIRALTQGTVTIATNSDISSSYVWFQNITFAGGNISFGVDGTAHHIMFYGCDFPNISVSAVSYGNSGIKIYSGAYHVYVMSCSFTCSGRGYNDGAFGVYVKAAPNPIATFLVLDCTMSGTLRDGVSNEGNDWGDGYVNNCDIARNTITDVLDDCIELDGDARNCRVWGNNLIRTSGDTVGSHISAAGIQLGPCYTLRNWMYSTTGMISVKKGNGDFGPFYFYHNTVSVSGSQADGISDVGGDPMSELSTYLNNILLTGRYCYYREGRSNRYDYNCLYPDPAGNNYIADEWNVSNSYQTIAALRAGTSQETHGIQSNVTLDANGNISVGSPVIAKALALNNVNGPNTPYPYVGVAPAMGKAELVSTTVFRLGFRIRTV